MVYRHEERVRKCSPIEMIQLASRPIFQGESKSEEGNLKFLLWLYISPYLWWYQERVRWLPRFRWFDPPTRPTTWGELESQDRIFIIGLWPVIQPNGSRVMRRGSGDLLQMGWSICHLDWFSKSFKDWNRESSYLICGPCYSCFGILTLKIGLMRVASKARCYISSGLIFWGESESTIRISKFLLCHPQWPYLCLIITPNIEMTITHAPTVKIVIPVSIT